MTVSGQNQKMSVIGTFVVSILSSTLMIRGRYLLLSWAAEHAAVMNVLSVDGLLSVV